MNRAESTTEKLPVLKELEVCGERNCPQQKCSDVGKELRAVYVLKPLFAAQKEGVTPQRKCSALPPRKKEDKKGGKPLPKSNSTLKGTKVANVYYQNENVLNPQMSIHGKIILRNMNKLE